MQQTEQYKLNQWDPEDRILREDFNADNLKIDAALAGKLGRLQVHYQRVSIGGGASAGMSSFSVKDWNELEYFIHFSRISKSQEETYGPCVLRLMGDDQPIATVPPSSYAVVLFPLHDAARTVSGLVLSKELTFFSSSLTYQELRGLDLSRVDKPYPNGDTLQLKVI